MAVDRHRVRLRHAKPERHVAVARVRFVADALDVVAILGGDAQALDVAVSVAERRGRWLLIQWELMGPDERCACRGILIDLAEAGERQLALATVRWLDEGALRPAAAEPGETTGNDHSLCRGQTEASRDATEVTNTSRSLLG